MIVMDRIRWLGVLVFVVLCQALAMGQTSRQLVQRSYERFARVKDYRADVVITTNIPSIASKPVRAQILYQQPSRLAIKSEALLILPKVPLHFWLEALADSNSFVAILVGQETIDNKRVDQVSVIPVRDTGELILAKLWIDTDGLIVKSQWTTRTQGVLDVSNTFGYAAAFGLPDRMEFTVDVQRFKLPKSVTLDLRSRQAPVTSATGKGTIVLEFSNYVINRGIAADDWHR